MSLLSLNNCCSCMCTLTSATQWSTSSTTVPGAAVTHKEMSCWWFFQFERYIIGTVSSYDTFGSQYLSFFHVHCFPTETSQRTATPSGPHYLHICSRHKDPRCEIEDGEASSSILSCVWPFLSSPALIQLGLKKTSSNNNVLAGDSPKKIKNKLKKRYGNLLKK